MRIFRFLLLTFALSFCTMRVSAQITISKWQFIEDFYDTSNVLDSEGTQCMLVKVKTTDRSFKYYVSPGKVQEVEYPNGKHPEETWVWVSTKCKYFKVLHPRYGQPTGLEKSNGFLEFDATRYPTSVWVCIIEIDNKQISEEDASEKMPYTTIAVNPYNSSIVVDTLAPHLSPRAFMLSPGKHNISIAHKGYRYFTAEIDADSITADTTIFYNLVKLHGDVSAKSSQLNVFYELFNSKYYKFSSGKLESQPKPGDYTLKASKIWHQSEWKKIHVEDSMEVSYDFTLKKIPLHWFAITNVTKPSGIDDIAYGGMIGFVRRRGLYFSMMGTFRIKDNGDIVDLKQIDYSAQNPYKNKSKCYYRATSGGVILRLWSPVHIYAGAGVGVRRFLWEGRDGLNHAFPKESRKGTLVEGGLIVNIQKVSLLGGVSHFDGLNTVNSGVGIYW